MELLLQCLATVSVLGILNPIAIFLIFGFKEWIKRELVYIFILFIVGIAALIYFLILYDYKVV